ncbi:hypothetical protein LOZ58_004690 [Ophidiomyces ophidiicola]|nr:hypothetical protein LOZ58_004690 [Ophidiomyces ophidiicola]
MSPTLVEDQPDHDATRLRALAQGFNALLEAAKQLTRQEQLLRSKLQSAHDEYSKLASQLTEGSTAQQSEVLDYLLKPNIDSQPIIADTTEWVRNIEQAGHITEEGAKSVLDASKIAAGFIKKPCQNEIQKSHVCPFSKPDVRTSMEKDFTTNGTKGNLHCPFKKPKEKVSSNGLGVVNGDPELCGNDDFDPIKAECRSDAPPCVTGSTRSTTIRCPIRYLNDHSPEAIAEYFQKHKHEIPRSHSICIQRYQKDPQNIRQLDEKYGDIVSMVKGLGVYHQPYLSSPPAVPVAEHNKHDNDATQRVEKWAEDVNNKSPNTGNHPLSDIVDTDTDDVEARDNNFKRSLRDVRVGESPSRPWGIHVPVSQKPAQSSVASTPAPAPVSIWPEVKEPIEDLSAALGNDELQDHPAKGRCPFGHSAKPEALEPIPVKEPLSEPSSPDSPHVPDAATPKPAPSSPHIVFNGPVILGYSGEAVALLLEKLAQCGKL